jgi:type II secretory pathway pseudopilin PulG
VSGAPRSGEAGYSLVALLAAVTVMLILMGAGSSGWKYIMKNDREEELIFRGGEIADAIGRYQKKNGNALPTSLEVLVKGKFLRHAYKDPMTQDGKWHIVRQGEAIGGSPVGAGPGTRAGQAGAPGAGIPGGSGIGTPSGTDGAGPGGPGGPGAPGGTEGAPSTTTPTTRPAGPGTFGGQSLGPMMGVASTSKEKGLRIFNGRTKYNEWLFVVGQPRVVGKPLTIGPAAPGQPGAGPGGTPRTGPTPLPMPTPGQQ